MFTFPLLEVEALIAKTEAAALKNGGWRGSYGSDPVPALWFVGDHGVYLCGANALAGKKLPFTLYSNECNPKKWRSTIGGKRSVVCLAAMTAWKRC